MSGSYDQLVILLSSGIGQRKMYFRDHPKVVACSERFAGQLEALLRESGQESFFLGVVDGKLVHDGRYLVGSTIAGGKVVAFAEQLHSGGFMFKRGAEPQELAELISLSADLTEPAHDLKAARALLDARGVHHIELSPVYEDSGWFGQFVFKGSEQWGSDLGDESVDAVIQLYQSLFHTVEAAHGQAGRGNELDVDGARAMSEKMLRAAGGGFMDLMQLVRYPDYDSYTVGHSVRVSMIAVLVGHRFGLSQELLIELSTAGLLHDVGKARIPEEILYKPTGLDVEERRVIEGHASLGAQILLQNRTAGPLAVAAALGHHWRHDGGGYPSRPPWATSSRLTALLHVCDVYEALTAVRPYKHALIPRRAYEIMLSDRGAFEPGLLAAFVQAMGLYPPGSPVQLSTGERAIVIGAGADIERPTVRMTHDAAGRTVKGDAALTIDLGRPEQRDVTVSSLPADSAEPETVATSLQC